MSDAQQRKDLLQRIEQACTDGDDGQLAQQG